MRPVNKLGLMLLIVAAALMLSKFVSAETLQCLPAHATFRASADATRDAGIFGLIVTIGAILFLW